MKSYHKLFFAFVALYGINVSLLAQELPKFEKLKLSSSPAFVVLGVEPENIQRPNTPTAFVSGLQSAIVNGKLQPNFALETSPVLWFNKTKNEEKQRIYLSNYLLARSSDPKSYWNLVGKSLTFSMATSESDTFTFGNLQKGTGISGGFRLLLAHGRVQKQYRDKVENIFFKQLRSNLYADYKSALEQLTGDDKKNEKVIEAKCKEILKNWRDSKAENFTKDSDGNTDKLFTLTGIEIAREINEDLIDIFKNSGYDALMQNITSQSAEVNKESAELLKEINEKENPLGRDGFMLELAAAGAGVFQNNEWKEYQHGKFAVWLTPSYRFNIQAMKDKDKVMSVDLMAVFRGTFNNATVDGRATDSSNTSFKPTHYFDAGFKFQYTYSKFSFATEFVGRYATQKADSIKSNWTWRCSLNADYKINDLITVTAAFGSNFDGNSTHYDDPRKIFAVGGINLGFSNMVNSSSKK